MMSMKKGLKKSILAEMAIATKVAEHLRTWRLINTLQIEATEVFRRTY